MSVSATPIASVFRSRPRDGIDVVSGPVGARAGYVGAGSPARAPQAPKGKADDPPSRNEGERSGGHRVPSVGGQGGVAERNVVARPRRALQATPAHLVAGRDPASLARLGEEARLEEDAVEQDGH